MARLFDDGANEYLRVDSAVLTAAPVTMAAWFRSDDITVRQTICSSCNSTVNDRNHFTLRISGNTAGDPVEAITADAAGGAAAGTAVGYLADTWHHGCAVFASATSRSVYLDGRNKASNAGNRTPAGIDRASIGTLADSAPGQYMSGRIAEVSMWSAVLTDNEVFQHAQGVPSPFIRPQSLKVYWTLFETDRDFWRSIFNLTAFNTPSWAPHPPKVLEFWRRYQDRAVTKQNPLWRIGPRVWNRWSPKGGFVRMPRYGYTLFQDPGIV